MRYIGNQRLHRDFQAESRLLDVKYALSLRCDVTTDAARTVHQSEEVIEVWSCSPPCHIENRTTQSSLKSLP
ncbi:hypothetical protein QQF64_029742 [Cirrhinus molitorella]|uniref:Uncharacterized protein n=1 Tax=Cirrhinus molitorella TaxID=172907 RepID=A0ABR3N1N3_9TELE